MTSNVPRKCSLDLAGSGWAEVLALPVPKHTALRPVKLRKPTDPFEPLLELVRPARRPRKDMAAEDVAADNGRPTSSNQDTAG